MNSVVSRIQIKVPAARHRRRLSRLWIGVNNKFIFARRHREAPAERALPLARAIDQIEVGRRVAGPLRIAFQTSDSESAAKTLAAAGATILAGPVITPWRDRNVRLQGPEGIQLTLFTPLGE